jgi:hypothetical protein
MWFNKQKLEPLNATYMYMHSSLALQSHISYRVAEDINLFITFGKIHNFKV